MDIQQITLLLHILSCILAMYIYYTNKLWKYFAVVLFSINFIGVLFYAGVLLFPNFEGHAFSKMRTLLQTLILFLFSYTLSRSSKHG